MLKVLGAVLNKIWISLPVGDMLYSVISQFMNIMELLTFSVVHSQCFSQWLIPVWLDSHFSILLTYSSLFRYFVTLCYSTIAFIPGSRVDAQGGGVIFFIPPIRPYPVVHAFNKILIAKLNDLLYSFQFKLYLSYWQKFFLLLYLFH